MSLIERNAIILAAGTSSRFVPLSEMKPKGLLEVRGEILVERQIRQLKEAGINDITLVTGYKGGQFDYLKDKYEVVIIPNKDYAIYNNTSSLIRVLERLGNTFICSSDNYFPENVFWGNPIQSFYSVVYASGPTGEYCVSTDTEDNIIDVKIGGHDSWYMKGHVYFSEEFSREYAKILKREYKKDYVRHQYWEDVYRKYLADLPKMQVRRFASHYIEEFDSIDELRLFDSSYVEDTRSPVLKMIASALNCKESNLSRFRRETGGSGTLVFSFYKDNQKYLYDGASPQILHLFK